MTSYDTILLGSAPNALAVSRETLAPLEKSWSAALTIDVTDDPHALERTRPETESEPNLIGSTGAKTVGWYRPRGIRRGARLTLRVTLLAGGAKKTRVHVVRAP